jgi:transposase
MARRSKSANSVAMRSRIVLAAAEGFGNTGIAERWAGGRHCPQMAQSVLGRAVRRRARRAAARTTSHGARRAGRSGHHPNTGDNSAQAVKRWLLAHPRFVLHFTPTSSSWLNLVERWFGELTIKKLKRGTHRSVRALNADIREWIKTWNENPRPYVWTKTADQILDSITRYCARVNDSRN